MGGFRKTDEVYKEKIDKERMEWERVNISLNGNNGSDDNTKNPKASQSFRIQVPRLTNKKGFQIGAAKIQSESKGVILGNNKGNGGKQ